MRMNIYVNFRGKCVEAFHYCKLLLASLRAFSFGLQFVILIADITLSSVTELTLPFLLITFETVTIETPAFIATSRIVTWLE